MFSMNEPDLGWWEKEEPEGWSAEDEADMRVTDAQENWVEWDTPRKPVRYETGWLFDEKEMA
jgi:hypothetical protein